MSEPVTNAQIEDVLSSIRRLVSEDSRPEMAEEAPVQEAVQQAVQACGDALGAAVEKVERLVLTPALRVNEPSGRSEPEAEEAPEDAVVEDVAETAAGEGSRSAPWSDPAATLFSATGQEAAAAEVPEVGTVPEDTAAPSEQEAAETEAELEEPLTFHSARAESLSAKIEALEAVIGRTRDQWEPDGTSDDSYSGTPVHPIGWRDAGKEERASQATEPEALPAATEAVAEPPEELVEDLTPEAFEVEDEMAGDRAAEDLAADEAVIDEDSLRELVAEIVRQELQGALGERITRNVRKLVRREIHRALAAQELD